MTIESLTASRIDPCDNCESTRGPILRISTGRGYLQLCVKCANALLAMLTYELEAHA